MYDLWIGSVIAALAVGVFVWGLIFWCVIRYRKRGDELPVQTRFNMPMEFLYTVAPFLIISVLFYYTAIVQTDVDKQSPQPGRRPSRSSRSSGTGSSTTATDTDPRAPTAQHGRVDARHQRVHPGAGAADRPARSGSRRPAATSSTRSGCRSCCSSATCSPATCATCSRSRSTSEGAYVGRCAELCGTYHSMMNFELRAVSPEEYDQFLAAQAGRPVDARRRCTAIGEEPLADDDARRSRPSATRRTSKRRRRRGTGS